MLSILFRRQANEDFRLIIDISHVRFHYLAKTIYITVYLHVNLILKRVHENMLGTDSKIA